MNIIEAAILAIVQGLTEFLPVSSSGHLVLGRQILGVANQGDVGFEVVVHFGTFLAVLLVFWQDIRTLLSHFLRGIGKPTRLVRVYREDTQFRLSLLMLLGMVPAGIVGLAFDDQLEALFADSRLVSGMLITTGVLLLLTKWAHKQDKPVTPWSALLIGIAQALAIIPGISRSGSTISVALYLGISRREAARFSFIMVLPLIFGAMLLQLLKMGEVGMGSVGVEIMLTGLVMSFAVGWAALKWLMGVLERGQWHWFAYYCFVIGLTGLVFT
ncbi:MAG: undecaprenyl-diphosphate phosphatase [Lentisphaeria bacterium]|nr:undecaprenyl-diphosphate phosphatase [Candidatus Neomarinimicrobiota bacterium]MCF7841332.1 undecaprenyl-diphosphate phosphatase [Lentisphaeria bacterium]